MVRAGDPKAMSSLSLLGKVNAGAILTSQQECFCLVLLLRLIQCSKAVLFSMRMFLWILMDIHMEYNLRLEIYTRCQQNARCIIKAWTCMAMFKLT